MTSYKISERFDVHTILFYGLALPLYRAALTIDATSKALRAMLPHLLFALGILAKALGLVAVVAGAVAAVACIPVTFWGGLLFIGALAYVGYPRVRTRKAVK